LEKLVALLMIWIAENSGYVTASLPAPEVVEMSPREQTLEAYGGDPEAVPEGGIDDRIFSLYAFEDGPNGTIYVLGAKWTEGGAAQDEESWQNPVFQEHVLHELVHHVQRLSGAYDTFPCRNYGEKEAYILGGKFLRQRYVEDRDGRQEAVALERGDILLYKGAERPHWREPFDGEWQIQVFLHFVRKGGPYEEFKYDKRPCLGAPLADDLVRARMG